MRSGTSTWRTSIGTRWCWCAADPSTPSQLRTSKCSVSKVLSLLVFRRTQTDVKSSLSLLKFADQFDVIWNRRTTDRLIHLMSIRLDCAHAIKRFECQYVLMPLHDSIVHITNLKHTIHFLQQREDLLKAMHALGICHTPYGDYPHF